MTDDTDLITLTEARSILGCITNVSAYNQLRLNHVYIADQSRMLYRRADVLSLLNAPPVSLHTRARRVPITSSPSTS